MQKMRLQIILSLFLILIIVLVLLIIPQKQPYKFPPLNNSLDNSTDLGEKDENDIEITLLFGGDVMLARKVGTAILTQNLNPFKNVSKLFNSADLAVVNLEVVVSDQGLPRPGKYYTFRADPDTLNVLTRAGIDAVSVANNHAGDYGTEAFVDMLSRLKLAGIGYFGGGLNAKEAYRPLIVDISGIKVGLVAFNMIETPYFTATANAPGHAWVTDAQVKSVIKQAQTLADVVVVMPHWGLEYTTELHPEQVRIGKLMVDAGADLVVGGHPHHIQKTVTYKEKSIIYSVGNLVFDGPGPNQGWHEGNLAELKVKRTGGRISAGRLKLIPYTVGNYGEITLKN